MSIKNNTISLQDVLNTINELPTISAPTISVNTSGLITATAGTKSSTYQLAFQPAKTITPSTTSQIAVSSGYYTGGNITVAGDSNLVASNIKSGISIFGVEGTLEEGGGSGEADTWSENEDAIISRTISTYTNDRVTTIGSYAFANCKNLTTVSFPAATIIGSNAFEKCSKLATISFPAVTSIRNNAFSFCSGLTTVSFPVATIISTNAFNHCYSLTTISFPAVTTIGTNAFSFCSGLTTVSFPVATTIGGSTFDGCSRLTTVSFPAVTSIGSCAFRGCSSLTEVNFPVATSIGSSAFSGCSSLTTVSFPAATSIGGSAFYRCVRLQSLYLGGSSVCKLSASNAFTSTPYAGYSASFSGTPYIYVPASLVSAYQSATNWTYFSSYFSAYEFEYETEYISFTVGTVNYTAESNMKWVDWVNSYHNTNGCFVDGNFIRVPSGLFIYHNDGYKVYTSDTIIGNHVYGMSAS